MTTRAQIVAAARDWIGTPFRHQGHVKRIACDCVGLGGGVAVERGLLRQDFWTTDFLPYAGYSKLPSNGLLVRTLRVFMPEICPADAAVGDLICMRFDGEPQHVGILADYRHGGLSLIHALERVGEVVEHRFSKDWQNKVTHAFGFPGVEA